MEVEGFPTREERSGKQTSTDEIPLAVMSWHQAGVTCTAKVNIKPHNNLQAI